MAFSQRFSAGSKAKAAPAPAPPPAANDGGESSEVESVEAEEDQAEKQRETERLRSIRQQEEEARTRAIAEAKQVDTQKAAEELASERRKAAEVEAAKRKQAADEQRRKAAEEAQRKAEEAQRKSEYEYEKNRAATVARSKAETAKRFGAGFGASGGAGFGAGGSGKFAWKKSAEPEPAPAPAGPSKALPFVRGEAPAKPIRDPRFDNLPSHDECEQAVSAMISRTSNGMKEGLAMLGLPNFPLTFVPGQELKLCGHNVREEINQMIHAWMTDEKDEFYNGLLHVAGIVENAILTEEEFVMMDHQELWVKGTARDGSVQYTKKVGLADGATREESDDDDEVVDLEPDGTVAAPAKVPALGPPPAARAAEPLKPAAVVRPALTAAAPQPAAAAAPPAEDYYAMLGVSPIATLQEIRSKFRALVVTEHPEKGGDPKKFAKLNKAYSVLSDQKKRQEYDASRA